MKKIISLLLAAAMLLSLSVMSGAKKIAYTAGDPNNDGTVNASDALLVLKSSVGGEKLDSAQISAADINRDGKADSSDALLLLKISIGLCLNYGNYPTLDYEWMVNAEKNYKDFAAEVNGNENLIPFIASSDQHGLVTADCEVFKFINDLVDWDNVSKILNLGDTVNLLHNSVELKAYSKAMKYIPTEKRLELFGNHDGHLTLFPLGTEKYFIAPGAEKSKNGDAFSVYDELFNVRYLAVDPMGYPWTYTSGRITESQADFIVKELEKEDAGDVVLLAHPYLFKDAVISRDGTAFTGSEDFIGKESVKQSFLNMLLARKNKTAGVFTDSDGKQHPYDFSKCKSDFLMTLHGHHHAEGYETCNGITQFMFQSFKKDEPNCFYFACIDREEKTFKCWKNIPGYDAWEIEIA